MNNPSMFLEPLKIRHGSIHSVNMNRKFYDALNRKPFEGDFIIAKPRRLCLVISITKSNIANCWVIPIKTKNDHNQYPYEIYKDITIKTGWDALLCISQMTCVPLECVDTREICSLNKETMEDIYKLIGEMIGQLPLVHMGEGGERYAKNLEPSVYKIDKPKEPDRLVYSSRTVAKKEVEIKDNRIKEYMVGNYHQSTEAKNRKYLNIIQREMFHKYGTLFNILDIKEICGSLGYTIKSGRNDKLYISGILKNREDMEKVVVTHIKEEDEKFYKNLSRDELNSIMLDSFVMKDCDIMKKYGLSEGQLEIIRERSNGTVHLG